MSELNVTPVDAIDFVEIGDKLSDIDALLGGLGAVLRSDTPVDHDSAGRLQALARERVQDLLQRMSGQPV